eukprot:10152722-Alexandrium_andersonii.AAC.1
MHTPPQGASVAHVLKHARAPEPVGAPPHMNFAEVMQHAVGLPLSAAPPGPTPAPEPTPTDSPRAVLTPLDHVAPRDSPDLLGNTAGTKPATEEGSHSESEDET